MIELHILKYLLRQETFNQYSFLIDEKFLKDESEELSMLYKSIKDFHSRNKGKDISSVDELEVIFHSAYPALPKKKAEPFGIILSRLREVEVPEERLQEYFSKLRKKLNAKDLALKALEVAQGRAEPDSLKDLYKRLEEDELSSVHSNLFRSRVTGFNPSLRVRSGDSLSWRLGCLNRSIGPLQTGDFGVVFARVETGKSTFVASEGSYMLAQAKSSVAWLTNEERGDAVLRRIVQAYLGWTNQQMDENPEYVLEVYKKEIEAKLHLIHRPDIHFRDAQALFREIKPELIICDQLDKIVGFDDDRNDLLLGKIYQWARRMSHEYAPFMGVTQASESAEGKRWLQSNDMTDSKTSKPAELDWLLGIGRTHDEALKSIRHLHIVKNKLPGGPDTVEELRHGKFDVIFEPQVGRYKDTMVWEK